MLRALNLNIFPNLSFSSAEQWYFNSYTTWIHAQGTAGHGNLLFIAGSYKISNPEIYILIFKQGVACPVFAQNLQGDSLMVLVYLSLISEKILSGY